IAVGDLQTLDALMRHALDVVHLDAVVDDPVVDDRDVGDVRRPVDDGRVLTPVEGVAVETPRRKSFRTHERPEADVDMDTATAAVTIAGTPTRIRGQRRPPDAATRPPERHPRRAPDAAGNPDPPVVGIERPAAIVEGRPAPGHVGHPDPAVI